MGVERRRECCICRYQQKKKLSKKELLKAWHRSTAYESDFECCFGAAAEGRSGDICERCRNLVRLRFRKDRSLSFPDVLDCNLECHSSSHDEHELELEVTCSRKLNLSTTIAEHAFCPPSTSIEPDSLFGNAERPADEIHCCVSTQTHEHVEKLSVSSESDIKQVQHLEEVLHVVSVEVQDSDRQHVSPSRRKRLRDESPSPIRKTRARIVSPTFPSFGNSQPVSFLGHDLPPSVISKILLYLPELDFIQVTIYFLLPGVCSSMANLTSQIRQEKKAMYNLRKCTSQWTTYTTSENHVRTTSKEQGE